MIKTFKYFISKIASTKDRKLLLNNIISLGTLQALNYILPLITFPYQIRVLGVERFGLLAFATSFIGYFGILVDYGFNLTAPRQIAIYREDKTKVSEIVSSIIQIKIGLLIIAAILLFLIINIFPKFHQDKLIYYISFGTLIGQILFPVWFYQGMEKMKYITIFNILARTIFTLLIFFVVKTQNDYFKVPLLNTFGTFIAGVVSWFVMILSFKIRIKLQPLFIIKKYFKESFLIFISNIAISIYTISTTFILGLFTNNTTVGYYATADKIIQIIKSLYAPITQSLYPFISKKVHNNKYSGLAIIRKITKYISIMTLLLSVGLFFASPLIINIIAGVQYSKSILPLRIMSFLPFIISISSIAGIQTMLTFGKNKEYCLIYISGSILNILLSLILVPLFKEIGSAICLTIVESFVSIIMIIYLKYEGISIFGKDKTDNILLD